MLRDLKWLDTDKPVADPLLGRTVLEELGLNKRALLATAAKRLSGEIDVDRLIGFFVEEGDGRVSRVMEGAFQADGGEKP